MPTPTEALFIRYAREAREVKGEYNLLYLSHATYVEVDTFVAQGLCRLGSYPSPRGFDLLATADAIDFDPATVLDPAPKPLPKVACGACENGRVVISRGGLAVDPDEEIEMTARCEACGGSGETPARTFKEMREAALGAAVGESFRRISDALAEGGAQRALLRHRVVDSLRMPLGGIAQPVAHGPGPSDARESLRSIVQAGIEAEQARARDALHATLGLKQSTRAGGVFYSPITRTVDGWTTDRDGIHTLLLRAEAKGLEVEVKHPRYDPGPSKVRVRGLGNGVSECWVILRPINGGFATQLLYASATFETITAVRIHDPWTRDPSDMDAMIAHASMHNFQVEVKVEAPEGLTVSASCRRCRNVKGFVSWYENGSWTIGTGVNWVVTTRSDVPAVLRAVAVRFKGAKA